MKYEWIFLRDYRSEEELRKLHGDFVKFFNNERIHQGLDYKPPPDEVYREGSFPSAIIAKKMTAENSLFSVKMSGKRACLYDSKRQQTTGDDTGDDKEMTRR